MKVSLVIPYRKTDQDRENNFFWIARRWQLLYPEFDKIICDSGSRQFSRSASRNDGVKSATGDIIIVADADTIPLQEFIDEAIGIVSNPKRRSWVIAHDGYCNLSQSYTHNLLRSSADVNLSKPRPGDCDHYMLESWAGMLVFPREALEEAGGWDENFKGWGYEDNAFYMKMDTLWAPHVRPLASYAMHMWHPAPNEQTFGQPDILFNRNLFEKYKKANGDPVRMRKLI